MSKARGYFLRLEKWFQPPLKRCFLYVVTRASVGFLLFLDFWNLFGFRY